MRDVRQPGDARHQGAEDRTLGHEHLARVPALRWPERADGVRDRLDAGQRRAAVGERAEQGEDHDAGDQPGRAGPETVGAGRVRGRLRQVSQHFADQPDDDHQDDRAREQVGRHGEGPARLLDPAQVSHAHEQDHADADLELVGADPREGRGHRGCPRRDLDRHGHHVVDKQRDRAHLGDARPEVLPCHHVRSAGPDVDHDDLAVGEQHEHHDEQDDQGHGQDQAERRHAERGHQHDEDFLGAVGRRGDPVRRQHAERERLGQPLFAEILVDQRRSQQSALGRVPERIGQTAAPVEQGCCLPRGHLSAPFVRSMRFCDARDFLSSQPE